MIRLAMLTILHCINFENELSVVGYLTCNLKQYHKYKFVVKWTTLVPISNLLSLELYKNANIFNFVSLISGVTIIVTVCALDQN